MPLRRLAGIGLPIGVGDKADRGVPGQVRRHRGGRIVQVQGQFALYQLQYEEEQQRDRREGQRAAGICAPVLFGCRVGTDGFVDQTLST